MPGIYKLSVRLFALYYALKYLSDKIRIYTP
jgi:hypothetical protein